MRPEEKLESLGLSLPPPVEPMANYVSTVIEGDLLYTSGAGPIEGGKPKYQGRVGAELSLEEGYDAARLTVLNLLSNIQARMDGLDRIEQVVKLLGFVSCAPDFHRQPEVINGASDLLVEVLGDRGRHARSAIGTSNLPLNIPVEIEMIVRVRTD